MSKPFNLGLVKCVINDDDVAIDNILTEQPELINSVSAGSTLLDFSIYCGCLKITKLLLTKYKINNNVKLLRNACFSSNMELIKWLYENEYDTNVNDECAAVALSRKASSKESQLEVVKWLVEKGISPQQFIIASICSINPNLLVQQYLVENNYMDLNIKYVESMTVLEFINKAGLVNPFTLFKTKN